MFSAFCSLQPHLDARVRRIQLRILPQQILRLFRNHFRQSHLHFNKLVALRARIAQRRRTFIAQSKLLTGLRSWRNAQLRLTFNRRHLDLRTERRLRNGDWHRYVNVVALAREIFVLTNVRDDVQVARRRTEPAALAFAGNAHARTRLNTSGNAHLHSLSLRCHAFAVTQRTRRSTSSRAATIRTLLRKPQSTTGSLYLTRAFTRRTNYHWSTNVARAVTARALLGTIGRDVCRQSLDRFFKREAQRHLDVSASLRLRPRRFLLFRRRATAKQVGKDIAKTAAAAA